MTGLKSLFALILVLGASVFANAQFQRGGDWNGCIDPKNTKPFSTDYGVEFTGDSLMVCVMGVSGTVTYGGANGPCFNPAITATGAGRIAFGYGATGTIQDDPEQVQNFTQNMALSFGYPSPGNTWGYAAVRVDGKNTIFGSTGFILAFIGFSDRYYECQEVQGDILIDFRCDVLGDAARLQWSMTNQGTAAHVLGLWFGQWTAMVGPNTQDTVQNPTFFSAGFGGGDKPVYVVVPGAKPPLTEQRYGPTGNVATVPPYVQFLWGQSHPYGLQVDQGPTASTEDSTGLNSDASVVDELALGQQFFLLGNPNSSSADFPDVMFGSNNNGGDVGFLDQPAFIQKFRTIPTAAGGSAQFVSYYHANWAVSNYSAPYSVVVDAPQLIAADSTQSSGLALPATGFYRIRVYVDNTRGFSTVNKLLEMDNVQVTLTLPQGLNFVGGDSATKVIPKVLPAADNLDFVEFHVAPDGVAFGRLPYSVTITPTPGPVKTISGTINVAATPKLTIAQGPNFVSTPFNFADSSWESVLGLNIPSDFQAFDWDPQQNGYVISSGASRAKATWIVSAANIGLRSLQSNPTQPSDIATGASNYQLKAGWNAIANPYNYTVPIGQLVGASAANPTQSFTWDQLVAQGFVNGGIAYFDSASGAYKYLQADTDEMLPNRGYWIFVTTSQDLTLNFPPIFLPGLPGSTRGVANSAVKWNQSSDTWRVQLVARDAQAVDDKNYIGNVPTSKQVAALQIMKPPVTPAKTGIQLSVVGTVSGKQTRLAQALGTGNAKSTYQVDVTAKESGLVTLTWPNISQVPGNVQIMLTDKATGASRILNKVSGYQFQATKDVTRSFTVQVQTGVAQRALISNVIVTRSSRSHNSPYTINYSLSGAATTSIRILSASNNEIYSITSGRAENAGSNAVTWNLRDSANRNVAPGTYRVEIVAESSDGSRSRSYAVLNVVR